MAYNPYAVSSSQTNLYDALAQAKGMETGMEASVKGHKGKLKGQFEDELMAAEKKAIAELERKRKESKGSKWFKGLTTLISLVPGWGQIAGAVMGGLGGAFGAKKQAKEAAKMAGRAKKYALDIDPKWQKSFLGGASKEYKSGAEKTFGDILKKAEKAKSKFGSLEGMLKTGLTTGLTSYATGKVLGGVGEKMKAAKVAKGAKSTTQDLIKAGMDPEMVMGNVDIAKLAKTSGVDEKLLETLMGAKAPGARGAWEGIKGIGGFGDEETFIPDQKGMDKLTQMLTLLEMAEKAKGR